MPHQKQATLQLVLVEGRRRLGARQVNNIRVCLHIRNKKINYYN